MTYRAKGYTRLIIWSLAMVGVGFIVGLVTTPANWFYDITYNPMTVALMLIINGNIMFEIYRRINK